MTAADLAERAAERVVAGMEGVTLPRELCAIDGRDRHLHARAWRSSDVPWARLVTVRGPGTSVGNLCAIPTPESGRPVLGVDLVQLGPSEVLVATDLVPMVGAPPAPRAELPAWARGRLSPEARVARVAPDALDGEVDTLLGLVDRWLATPETDGAGARERQAAYLRAHRDEDHGLRLLAAWFGPEVARQLLERVMFPEPSW